jgi:hypothetical protein
MGMVDNEVNTVEDIVEAGMVVVVAVDTGEYMVVLACCGVHIDWTSFYYLFLGNFGAAAGSEL